MKRRNLRNLLVLLSLILALTLGIGCSLLPKVETQPPPGPPVTQNATPVAPGWSIPVNPGQASALPSIADVVARVKPSVVAINTKIIGYDFFNRPVTQEGAGSGWILTPDGVIVTNNHVIQDAQNIIVTLADGRTFPVDPKTVATDPLTDLAVLKIAGENLTAAAVGDSQKLRVGDWVVAIGNSLGRGIRATVGIVSQLGVSIEVDQGQTLYDLIDTSSTINPGNSGGPLVNLSGEVIGITSAKIAATGVEATGYAISINTAKPTIEQLIQKGYVVRPYLGIGLYTVDQFVVSRYNLAVNKGVLLTSVTQGSPADKAGLKVGDVITKFGEQETNDVNQLRQAIHSSQAGQKVAITFWRGETKNTTYATLIESPPPS